MHSYANSATLLIFLQVRSSVAVGTPDYISPEILQVCMEVTFLCTNYLINQSDSRHHFEIPVGPRMKQFIIIYYKFLVGGAVSSWFVRSTPVRAVWVRALAGDMCCVLGQDTLLSRCLFPPRCINGYQRT